MKIWQKVCVLKRSNHQIHQYQIEHNLRWLSQKEHSQTAHSQNVLQPCITMVNDKTITQWATVEFESLFIPADFQCNF